MEAFAAIVGSVALGFLLGAGLLALASRGVVAHASAVAGFIRDLVAEHLSPARDRLEAAEARIALLEERLAFHDGFLRATPREGAARAESPRVCLDRGARSHEDSGPAAGGRGPRPPEANVLAFPTSFPPTE